MKTASIAARLKLLLSGLVSVFICSAGASAHEGPPYPIIVDQKVGGYMVSVWGDPDVGTGTFFIILEPTEGSALAEDTAEDIKIELGVQPVNGRLAEAHYSAWRDAVRNRVQYKAEVPFDREELWRVRFSLQGPRGSGEIVADVEVTPPGYGRWDLLIYLFPFVAIGLLWLRAVLRARSRKRRAAGL
ncbi:MAG TPA: hypothetical protein VFQ92_08445 [Blastocatellia bacterium]|nr:hypothetical protein [Blastocatellia bacterium]